MVDEPPRVCRARSEQHWEEERETGVEPRGRKSTLHVLESESAPESGHRGGRSDQTGSTDSQAWGWGQELVVGCSWEGLQHAGPREGLSEAPTEAPHKR